jgi:hypothetical protein
MPRYKTRRYPDRLWVQVNRDKLLVLAECEARATHIEENLVDVVRGLERTDAESPQDTPD